jgi:Raf kinase inhibitor-like YbhB/YbcL family protein
LRAAKRLLVALLFLSLLSAACSKNNNPAVVGESVPPSVVTAIHVTSSAFAANADVPVKYTCQGQNVSVPLEWTNIPSTAKELALVMFDPDAPNGGFLHWVVFKIAPTVRAFPEGSVPSGVRQGRNGTGKAGYLGPCPPAGPVHHYRFTLSALRSAIDLPDGAPAADIRSEISKSSIAEGLLVGLYKRS